MRHTWEQAFRVLHPDSCTKIRAALSRHQELGNQLAYLQSISSNRGVPGVDGQGLPDLGWWKGKVTDRVELSSIFQQLQDRLQRLASSPIEQTPEELEYARMVQAELDKRPQHDEKVRHAIEFARTNSAQMNAALERVKQVNKKPENLTPETKVEFEARVARGDYSPFGHPKEEFEAEETLKDDDH